MMQAITASDTVFTSHSNRSQPSPRAPTLAFFPGLGGSSLLGGAVTSLPVTPTAGRPSSGLATPKEGKRHPKQMFFTPSLNMQVSAQADGYISSTSF